MSDSESIQFHEQSYSDSEKNAEKCNGHQTSQRQQGGPAAFQKPPLHSNRRGVQSQPRSSAKHSLHDEPRGGDARRNVDAGSDYSESIRFYTEVASATPSVASLSRSLVTSMSRGRGRQREPRSFSRGHVEQERSDSCDGSIQFVLEESSSTPPARGRAQSEMSFRNDSDIHFVMEETSNDSAGTKAVGISRIAPTIDGSDSTIIFEVEDDAVTATATSNSHPKSSLLHAAPGSSNSHLPPKKTIMSNRLHRTNESSMREASGACTAPTAADRERPTETIAAPLPAITAVSAAPSLSQPTSKKAHSGRSKAVRGEKHGGRAHSKDERRSSSLGAASVTFGKAQDVAIPPHGDDASPQKSENAPPEAVAVVPTPHPRVSEFTVSPTSSMLTERILEAKLYTEHWRLFNDIQREEIMRLGREIARARAEDSLSNVVHSAKGGTCTVATVASGFGAAVRTNDAAPPKGKISGRIDRPASRYTSAMPQSLQPKMSHPLSQRSGLPSNCKVARGSANEARKTPEKPRQELTPSKIHVTAPPVKEAGFGWFSRLFDDLQRDAAVRVAESLGVVWPPYSKDALFFISGARLTQQQRDEFYSAVELQRAASNVANTKLQAACKAGLTAKGRRVARRKPLMTRTAILRRAFALMDVEQKGVICAVDIPALQQMLRAELEQLEAAASGKPAVDTVLSRARMVHHALKGSSGVCVRRPSVDVEAEEGVLNMNAEITLYRFVLDALFPLLSSSGMIALDFTAVGLLVFGSMNISQGHAGVNFVKWRQASLHHFKALARVL